MTRPVLPFFVLLVLSAASGAADVHKCATPTGIAYQDVPCSGAELPASGAVSSAAQTSAPARVSAANDASARVSAANDGDPRATPVCGPRPREVRRLPWRRATICIGMTDDEVLNLPGWGPPANITRTRAPREWREEWRYDAGLDRVRQLQFVNGTLTLVGRQPADTPAGPLARATLAGEAPFAVPR